MPRRVIGREVTHGTICRDHWVATVTVTCADVLPAGVPSPLLLSVAWRDRDSGAAVERNDAQKVRLAGQYRKDYERMLGVVAER